METQDELNTEIGNKETTVLKPAKVKIVKVEVEAVGDKGTKKLVMSCKHPEKEELIKISAVKFEKAGKLEVVGTWYNLDEDKKIKKGSALAVLMNYLLAQVPRDLEGKDSDTILDSSGYLCFKCY